MAAMVEESWPVWSERACALVRHIAPTRRRGSNERAVRSDYSETINMKDKGTNSESIMPSTVTWSRSCAKTLGLIIDIQSLCSITVALLSHMAIESLIHVWINTVLYLRHVYPRELFTSVTWSSLHLHQIQIPLFTNYLNQIISAIQLEYDSRNLLKVSIEILSIQTLLERHVITLSDFNGQSGSDVDVLRSLIVRLRSSSSALPTLPPGSITFIAFLIYVSSPYSLHLNWKHIQCTHIHSID